MTHFQRVIFRDRDTFYLLQSFGHRLALHKLNRKHCTDPLEYLQIFAHVLKGHESSLRKETTNCFEMERKIQITRGKTNHISS